MIKVEEVKNENREKESKKIPDEEKNPKLKRYLKAGEYVLVAIVLFVLAIIFWHLIAQLYKAIKAVEKIRNS